MTTERVSSSTNSSKVALVTEGSRGQGAAHARRLASDGAVVQWCAPQSATSADRLRRHPALHDIEFVPLEGVLTDAYGELSRLRDEGKCRFIGMTGYALHALRRAIAETDLDVVLNYAHFTLLNTELTDGLLPTAHANDTAVINAAAVALGLLTPGGLKADIPVSEAVIAAARRANEICRRHSIDIAFLANQFAIQRSGCPTTVIGRLNRTTSNQRCGPPPNRLTTTCSTKCSQPPSTCGLSRG